MALIDVSNLTFAYEGSYDNIFEDVSFQIDTDWKLGFTGRNGKGKTTFLNLLLASERSELQLLSSEYLCLPQGGLCPTERNEIKYEYTGKISASVQFQYFPYAVPDRTIPMAAVIEQICPSYQDWELLRELSLLEVNDDVLTRPFATLSNGEQTKVMLAALFLDDGKFLLIDEPTNHLDMKGREIVSKYLNGKSGFIVVSHDRAFLDGCVTHILSINKANIEIQRGNFSVWWDNKKRQDSFELAENEKLQKDIKRLKQAAKQSSDWADKVESTKIGKGGASIEKSMDKRAYIGEKSRRMQQRRKNLERRQQNAIDEKSHLLKNLDHASSLKITQLSYHKQRYLALSDVGISYGSKLVCENISFDIQRGDRVALHGKNGSGKSSILKLICRNIPQNMSFSGELAIGSGLQISYVSQDTSFLSGSLTDYARQNSIDESLFKAILRKLDFPRVQFEKDMRDFSGGQKKKVLIAKSLCEKSHLLVWDEPLNFVDVLSRMQIEELLLEYKPTILFVEHDSVFCDRISTKRVDL